MKKKLSIEGMKCSHCVGNLTDVLTEDITGVEVLEVSLDEKYAIVEIQDNATDADIKAVIDDLGYELKGIE